MKGKRAHVLEGEADVKPIITIKCDICEYLTIPTWLECCESGYGEVKGGRALGKAPRGELLHWERGLQRRLEVKVLVERLLGTCTSGTLSTRRTFASQGTPAWAFSPPTPSSNAVLQKTLSPCVSTNPWFIPTEETGFGIWKHHKWAKNTAVHTKGSMVSKQMWGNTVNLARTQRNAK